MREQAFSRNEKLFNRQYVFFCIINLAVSLSFSMVSTIMSRYVSSLGMSVAVAGAITGAFSIASMVVRPVSGFINDRMRKKLLLILSNAFMGAVTLCYGLTTSPTMLLVLRILHGAAFSVSSTVNLAVIPGIVPEKRMAEAISYYGVIQSVAIAAGPSMGLALANISGYPLNFTVAALLAGVGVALAISLDFINEKPVARTGGFAFRLGDVFAKECLVLALLDVAIASVSGLENSLIALYGPAVGIDNIGWYFTLSAATLMLTRLFFGKLSDKRGTAAAVYPGMGLMIVGLLLLWNARAPWVFAVASVIKTVGVGMARPAIQAACLKTVPASRRGAASSTYYLGSDIGQGTAPAIGGRIVDATGGNYGLTFALYAIPLAVSCGVYAVANALKKRKAREG